MGGATLGSHIALLCEDTSWQSFVKDGGPYLITFVTLIGAAVFVYRTIVKPATEVASADEKTRREAEQKLTEKLLIATEKATADAKETARYTYNTARVLQQIQRESGICLKRRPSEGEEDHINEG